MIRREKEKDYSFPISWNRLHTIINLVVRLSGKRRAPPGGARLAPCLGDGGGLPMPRPPDDAGGGPRGIMAPPGPAAPGPMGPPRRGGPRYPGGGGPGGNPGGPASGDEGILGRRRAPAGGGGGADIAAARRASRSQ